MDSRIARFERLREEGAKFNFGNASFVVRGQYGGPATPEYLTWMTRVRNLIQATFSEDSPACIVVSQAFGIATQGYHAEKFDTQKRTLLKALDVAIEALQDDVFSELQGSRAEAAAPSLSNRVFVVHGHDDGLKTAIENFLRAHGLDPVVLHRQPDQGRTLIEKFEEHSDVGYAFVLLTPDDIAYPADQATLPDDKRKKEMRARQNVILELGYFVGKLTRARVCCLFKKGVTLPNDISGVVYKDVSEGLDSKAYEILKELKAAGYTVTI